MIVDRVAYERLRVADERRTLAALSAAETLAIGEALWTSVLVMELAAAPEPRGENAARRLRILPDRLALTERAERDVTV